VQVSVGGLPHLFQQTIQIEGSLILAGWELPKRRELLGGQSLGGIREPSMRGSRLP